MTEILKIVGQYGGFPAIIMLGMAWALYKMWKYTNEQQKQLIDLQNLRVNEAKEVRSELMKFSEGTNQALSEISSAVTSLKDAIILNFKPKRD